MLKFHWKNEHVAMVTDLYVMYVSSLATRVVLVSNRGGFGWQRGWFWLATEWFPTHGPLNNVLTFAAPTHPHFQGRGAGNPHIKISLRQPFKYITLL